MATFTKEAGTPVLLTSSGAISKGPGTLLGFFVSSTSTGTIVLNDGGASGTAISGTITPAAGQFYRFPAQFVNAAGAYAVLANTISVTFFWNAG